MAVLDGSQEPIKFSGEIDLISRQNWRNNVLHSEWTNPVSHSGIALAALELKQYQAQGLLMPPVEVIEACYNPVSFEVDPHLVVDPRALLAGQIKRLKHSPDIDLRELDDAVRPLEFADVGPSWLKENPSTYVREAKVEGRLLDMMKESHKRRKLSYP